MESLPSSWIENFTFPGESSGLESHPELFTGKASFLRWKALDGIPAELLD